VKRSLRSFARACYATRNLPAARHELAAAMLAADLVAVPYLDALYVLRGGDVLAYPFHPDAGEEEVTQEELSAARKRLKEIRAREDREILERAQADALIATLGEFVVRPDGTTPMIADAYHPADTIGLGPIDVLPPGVNPIGGDQ
jgi:hypothetical protein